MLVRVAVNIPSLSGEFDYSVPDEQMTNIQPGSLVIVPFGKQTVQGIVTAIISHSDIEELRPILEQIDSQPAITPALLELAGWLANHTFTPLSVCLDAMLPPGISQHADTEYRLASAEAPTRELQPGIETRLYHLIKKRQPVRGRQIQTALPRVEWKPAAQRLVKAGWLEAIPVLPPPGIRPRYIKTAALAVPPEKIDHITALPGRADSQARRMAALQFLKHEPLPVALPWVYASSQTKLADLTALADQGWIQLNETEWFRDPLDKLESIPNEYIHLTRRQQSVWQAISQRMEENHAGKPVSPILLHGVTGSGKTELYLRAVQQALNMGKQALVLVPEISLTPQTAQRFVSRFPGMVGLIHSRLSAGERYDTWRRARNGDLKVIIGPRSALFTPLTDPGLIILDEAHDENYHQRECQPFYDAVDSSIAYSRFSHSLLILGTATPNVTIYWQAKKENWDIFTLPHRVRAHRADSAPKNTDEEPAPLPLPVVTIVDMRTELKSGNTSPLSRQLQHDIQQVLEKQQQAILFLNRRGSASYVFCRNCGQTICCPQCLTPLTAHQDNQKLLCHTCNYQRQMPKICPSCRSSAIRALGAGTEKLEKEVQKLFPTAQTLRWDADTTRSKGSHNLILSYFRNQQADILIGTQMLAKGLDLPQVTLVGAVLADLGLNLPDYRSNERTFQLLTQVAGRAGRSALGGKAIFQTYQPESPVIQAAAQHDFSGFYQQELKQRSAIGYPPFSRLIRLEYRSQQENQAASEAARMEQQIRHWMAEKNYQQTRLIGPVPCYFKKINGWFRWQIILCGADPADIIRNHTLKDWLIEADPPNLL